MNIYFLGKLAGLGFSSRSVKKAVFAITTISRNEGIFWTFMT